MQSNPEQSPDNQQEIEIKQQGSFLDTDEDGFVINPASPEKLQDDWRPALNDVVSWYKNCFGDNLSAVYLRGSVAKGEAIKNISDIDTFAYVGLPEKEISEQLDEDAKERLNQKYSFVNGIESVVRPLEKSDSRGDIILRNQSLCIYGDPIDTPRLKPGKKMALHALHINGRLEKLDSFMEEDQSGEKIKRACVWFMKGLVRSGCEVVMERSGKYTRDLYPCYEIFSKYYPEKEAQMREALYLALNPTSDKAKIASVMRGLGSFLQAEAEAHL